MQLRNKTPRLRVTAKLRDDRAPATGTHDVWAMDFVHDQLALGSKIRILTVIDTFSRFAHAIDARLRYRAENVVALLEEVCSEHGYPKMIRVDQGSEFISRDLDLWAYANNVILDFSRSHCLAGKRSAAEKGESHPTMPSSRHSTAGYARSA